MLIASIRARLNNPQYRAQLQALNEIDQEPFLSTREMRNRILALSGEEAVKEWITNKIIEPRWDTLDSSMPNLGLTHEEAASVANLLLKPSDQTQWWRERIFSRRFLAGVITGIISSFLILFVISHYRIAQLISKKNILYIIPMAYRKEPNHRTINQDN